MASLTGLALEHPDTCTIVGTHGMFLGRALVGLGCRHVDWAFCRELPMPVVFAFTFDGPAVTVRGPSA